MEGVRYAPMSGGDLATRDDFASYYIRPVEARQLHAPALWYLSDDQAHSPLHNPSICGFRWRTRHIVADPFVTIFLVGYLGLCQHHHIVISNLDRPNVLDNAKSPSVTYFVRPEV